MSTKLPPGPYYLRDRDICDATGHVIISDYGGGSHDLREFFCKAANAHDALMAFTREAIKFLGLHTILLEANADEANELPLRLLAEAETALALAEPACPTAQTIDEIAEERGRDEPAPC